MSILKKSRSKLNGVLSYNAAWPFQFDCEQTKISRPFGNIRSTTVIDLKLGHIIPKHVMYLLTT